MRFFKACEDTKILPKNEVHVDVVSPSTYLGGRAGFPLYVSPCIARFSQVGAGAYFVRRRPPRKNGDTGRPVPLQSLPHALHMGVLCSI